MTLTRQTTNTIGNTIAAEAPTKIAVIIPCLNEADTIAQVIHDLRKALPQALLCVFDNGSSDLTVANAKKAGAEVSFEPRRGKGRVLKKAFAEINADIYITIDGDNTYDAAELAKMLLQFQQQKLDMLVANRLEDKQAHPRPGHYLGNLLFSKMISTLFACKIQDPFSGMRIMSQRLVKTFPSASKGFQVEIELTIHALDLDVSFREVPTHYQKRPENSFSKLNTYKDGIKILTKLLWLYQLKKPLKFYGISSLFLLIIATITFSIPLSEYLNNGKVSKFPTLIVSMSTYLIAFTSLSLGLILEHINSHAKEIKRSTFLGWRNL